jgi:hypothetical protein
VAKAGGKAYSDEVKVEAAVMSEVAIAYSYEEARIPRTSPPVCDTGPCARATWRDD